MLNPTVLENRSLRVYAQSNFQRLVAAGLAMLLIGGLLCFFTLQAYPTGDDGWYDLCIRQGIGTDGLTLTDRPLSAYLFKFFEQASESSPFGLAIIHTLLWVLLAIESYCLAFLLWRPDFQEAVLAALLTLAPVIVKSGIVTITYDPSTTVPVILAYAAALLYIWNLKRALPKRLYAIAALFLCFLAGLISEYGVCAGLACAAFLLTGGLRASIGWRQSFRAGLAMFAASMLAYLCFALFFTQFQAESKKNLITSFEAGRLEILGVLPSGFSHVVSALFGSIISQFGSLQYEIDSKWTLVAFAVGCLLCLLIYFCGKGDSNHPPHKHLANLYLAIVAAVVIAILPFMLAGRNAFEHYLNTRYYLPSLPFAVIGSLIIGSTFLSAKGYRVYLLVLAFLCGHVTVTHLADVLRHEQKIASLGKALEPYASHHKGITLFVLAREQNSAISLTGKATKLWSAELSHRTWIIPETEAHQLCGSRKSHDQPTEMKLNHRGLLREGPIDAIYYVDVSPSNEVLIEPYSQP
jgi:hypothetical protein